MKNRLVIIGVLLLLAGSATYAQKNLRLGTWNLRFDNPKDGENIWNNRKSKVIELINFHDVDILCTQEGLKHQLDFIRENDNKYDYVGVGRDNGDTLGEYTAIFFKKDRFKILEQKTFWLSEKPDSITKSWDAALVRICTWAKVKDEKNQLTFYVFNTHFDHIGVVAREKSAELILRKIHEITKDKYPAILAGDFNSQDTDKAYLTIVTELSDSYLKTKEKAYGPVATFNGFEYNKLPKERIDYIFTNKNASVKKYGVLNDSYDLHYPSDHFPVIADLKFHK